MSKYSPEEIVGILHSIETLYVGDGYLEVRFKETKLDSGGESISSFIPGSFTRELLELIEDHLFEEKPE